MAEWGWLFGAVCLVIAVIVVLGDRREARKTMDTLNRMLDEAMNGDFRESDFDESLLSALETRFAHYLSASAHSAQNVAEEKDRIKTLISDISHQTKTPIANLLLYTELLGEEKLSPEAQQSVEACHSQAEKLHFLIDALVKLSRLENGILTLSPQRENLGPMLRQVREQFAAKAQDKGLALTLKETDVSAVFDAKWTAEALCNVVDNAIKYTDHGGVSLSVQPYELFVCIEVRDTGRGIPEAEQGKIFSRFYRSSESANQEGVGVGLYLTREILRKEGGYMKLSSHPGQGSVFSLCLPA